MGRTRKAKRFIKWNVYPKIIVGIPYTYLLSVLPHLIRLSLNTFWVKIATQLLQNIKIDVPNGVDILSKKSLHLKNIKSNSFIFFLKCVTVRPQPWILISLSVHSMSIAGYHLKWIWSAKIPGFTLELQTCKIFIKLNKIFGMRRTLLWALAPLLKGNIGSQSFLRCWQ